MSSESERTKGYLYSMNADVLTVREGYVVSHKWHWRSGATGSFMLSNGSFIQCNVEPGVVHRGVVWLTERDDKYAQDLFVEKEYEAINELQEKIHKHEEKIRKIREGVQ